MSDYLFQVYLVNANKMYACAGGIIEDEKVIEAAPIIKYMTGWHIEKVQTYCAKKGWLVELFTG